MAIYFLYKLIFLQIEEEVCLLRKEFPAGGKRDRSTLLHSQRLYAAIKKWAGAKMDLEQNERVMDFLEDFAAQSSLVVKERRKTIGGLKVGKEAFRERLGEYDDIAHIFGDTLEEIVLAKLMRNTVRFQKKVQQTAVGQKIVEATKVEFVKLMQLSKDETWDLQIRAGLTDEQLDKVRFILKEKTDGFERLLKCSRTTGKTRRKEQESLFERLKKKRSKSGGTYVSILETMKLIIELFGKEICVGDGKTHTWKVGIDGRKIGGKDQVMCGVTPLSFGLPVQSCYCTFPVAIVCGKEDMSFLNDDLKPLFIEFVDQALQSNLSSTEDPHVKDS